MLDLNTPLNTRDALLGHSSLFQRFYVPKIFVQKVEKILNLYSEGPMFRRYYVQKVLCSGHMFRTYVFKR